MLDELISTEYANPVDATISYVRDGDENEGDLQSVDLFVTGRGIHLLVNVTVDGHATYSLSVDGKHFRSGRIWSTPSAKSKEQSGK